MLSQVKPALAAIGLKLPGKPPGPTSNPPVMTDFCAKAGVIVTHASAVPMTSANFRDETLVLIIVFLPFFIVAWIGPLLPRR